MQQQVSFAGSMSNPLIKQALGILASEGVATFDGEQRLDLDPDVIVLAVAGERARFPNHFLRLLPPDIPARKQEVAKRSLGIDDQVLEIPNLVLVQAPRGQRRPDGLYTGRDLTRFEAALKNLAGIKPPKLRRNRESGRARRAYGGLVPDLN
jgi:hypothetical protein